MTYNPTWSNAGIDDRLTEAHYAGLSDVQELITAMNHRRRLVYLVEQNVIVGETVSALPLRTIREQITDTILTPAAGSLGGTPSTPASMEWLWPVADANENGTLSTDSSGDVSLFAELNGTSTWTDSDLDADEWIRAAHLNELRQSLEWISRGRWTLPIYFTAGLFSILPDTSWMGEAIANNGTKELRTIGYAVFRTADTPVRGLTGVTARTSSKIEITADTACSVDVYHVKRAIDFASDSPTWNEYDPSTSASWTTAGGIDSADATYIGTLNLSADTPASLTGSAVQSVMQAILDGGEPNFLVRRSDIGTETIQVTGNVVVEFDLDTPPN